MEFFTPGHRWVDLVTGRDNYGQINSNGSNSLMINRIVD